MFDKLLFNTHDIEHKIQCKVKKLVTGLFPSPVVEVW